MQVNKIDSFSGNYRFLSNFYPSPINSYYGVFDTVEHFYQAHKTSNYEEIEFIRLAPTPGEAKRRGRRVTMINAWDDVKFNVMLYCVTRKFEIHKPLLIRLIETGDAELIEGNHWGDTYWGVC